MEVDSYEHGVPSWVDLGTADTGEDGRVLLRRCSGGTCSTGPPEAGGYSIAELRGRPVAGLGPQQNPGPPYWSTYVNVDDADKVVAKATEAGGTVFVPTDGRDGRRAAWRSSPIPLGAVIGVWQPNQHKGAGIVNEPGTLAWNELVTTDTDGPQGFYEKVFGWGAVTHGEGAGAYTEFQVAGRSIAGMMEPPRRDAGRDPPYWGVYFDVADTDATVAAGSPSSAVRSCMPPCDIETRTRRGRRRPGRGHVQRDRRRSSRSLRARTPMSRRCPTAR